MNSLFNKRMEVLQRDGGFGVKLVRDSNIIESKTFENDVNFREGMLYDWKMNELEFIKFKFQKVKTRTAEGIEVEHAIRFMPDYNPENLFKNYYDRKDGKERLGLYIDVLDVSKKLYEKWLIVNKDDRVAFDRYNTYRCNWFFEWVTDGVYYKCLGCVMNKESGAKLINSELGGTTIDGDLVALMPTNDDVRKISLRTKFMICDNPLNPQIYEVIKVNDISSLGVSKIFLKQTKYNVHKDFCGIINGNNNVEFLFDLPIDDLPEEYGGEYHMICDCLKNKNNKINIDKLNLESNAKELYINGQPLKVKISYETYARENLDWKIFVLYE